MNRLPLSIVLCCLWFLSACDGARHNEPILISSASLPAPDVRQPSAPWTMEKSISLDITVPDLAAAVASATEISADLDGFVTYYAGSKDAASLTLLVPAYRESEALRRARRLGAVNSETLLHSSTTVGSGPRYTNITLRLWESLVHTPPVSRYWNPGDTASRAFAVFMSIFRVIADTVIWIVVVIGPFAVAGTLAYLLIRRFLARRSH